MCLAIPGKVETITGDDPITRMGRINFGGVIKEASLAYVPEVQVGDYVIVHVGFALSKVDEAEAQKVFGYLKQMESWRSWRRDSSCVMPAGRPKTANQEASP
jgi:hydrogenase expression/formation protein HypC